MKSRKNFLRISGCFLISGGKERKGGKGRWDLKGILGI